MPNFNFYVMTGVVQQNKRSRATIYLMVDLNDTLYYLNAPEVKGLLRRMSYRTLLPELNFNNYSYISPVTIALKYTRTVFGKPAFHHITKIKLAMDEGYNVPALVINAHNFEIFRGWGTLITDVPETFIIESEYKKICKHVRLISK